MKDGGLAYSSYEKLIRAIELFDMNRALGHIQKVEVVKGDVRETLPKYVKEHPELIVGMLYLDVDLYQPTIEAIDRKSVV